jgi:hypothetical protein
MPDRGLLNTATVEGCSVLDPSRTDMELKGVRWCQATFEVDKEAVLNILPCEVSRPIPCYARLLVAVAEVGTHGPMGLAILSAGARSEMMPRNVVVQCVVDGPLAAAQGTFGGPIRPGKITLERRDAGVVATIADGSGKVVTVRLPDLRPIDDAMLRWDTWLGWAGGAGGPELVEFAPTAQPKASFLSRKSEVEVDAELPATNIWRRFRNLNTISACFVEGDLTIGAAQPRRSAV